MNPKLAQLRKLAVELPNAPGVYIMKDKTGKIIYIGKAKVLKNRVSQYFAAKAKHDVKVASMVENVDRFDYIVTDSEFEALILEASLIKQHTPKYNILLKDDKGYSYIRISPGPWSKITATFQREDDGATYMGPYNSSFIVTNTVDEVNKLFKLPTCGKVFPRDIKKGRPCLNSYIDNCCAPCSGRISAPDYENTVKEALMFLRGGTSDFIKRATAQMEEAAENLEFEKAARLRDMIRSVRDVGQKQKVVYAKVEHQDVIAVSQNVGNTCFEVFRFNNGRLYDNQHYIIDSSDDPVVLRGQFVLQYYMSRPDIPPRITVDGDVEDSELLEKWLTEKRGKRVSISVPQKGGQAQLVQMCSKNAFEHLAREIARPDAHTKVLNELAELISADRPLMRIEAYDISHFSGSENVAGMVVFKNGLPSKSDYRRFKIKSFSGQDDYASMAEVLDRRCARYIKEKGENNGFGELPDLILLDGGLGQVDAVLPIIEKYELDVPVFGMVKDDKHRTRALISPQGEISISSLRGVFTLISNMQEEVHRFAITFQRERRKKTITGTLLTNIDGVGEKRAAALLKHFKGIRAIKEASVEEISAVKGIDAKTAVNIYNYFRA